MEESKKERIKKECLALLRKVKCNEKIIRHCLLVANLALEIAKNKKGISKEIILKGALLHDIGRVLSSGIDHGFLGGGIARKLGVEEKVVKIIQRHVGAGISAKEAKKFGLPEIDLKPKTMEEKIVAQADNLMENEKRISIEKTIKKLEKKLGKKHPAIKRMKKLHQEVMYSSCTKSCQAI